MTTGTKQLLITFYTFGNKELKRDISKSVFWVSRNLYFAHKGVRKEGRVWQKEDFHMKGTFNYITAGTKQLQMSFYKFGNK